ncbi:MAG: SpoIIE family protein phosphatase [Opitutae bacterium]
MTVSIPSAEPSPLRALVGHSEFVRGDEKLEAVQQRFATSRHDFMAVVEGRQLLGLCARRDIGTLLGARYGFALYARAEVRQHLTPDAIKISVDTPLTEVLQTIAGRRDEHFYDDVLLVDRAGDFVGLVYVRNLVRQQTTMLMGNIAELEVRQREIAEKNQKMEDDLRMAREVQLAMLPREFPMCRNGGARDDGLGFAHLYEPAGGVGGDFFDVIAISDTQAGIIICDVMGHGVRSALITAMVRTMIEELRSDATDPAKLLTRLNAHLTKLLLRTGDMIFVTAVYAVIDVANQRLTYAQAGHPTPLHWSALTGQVQSLPEGDKIGGLALGLLEDSVYAAAQLPLLAGDRVLFFTDGITEAANAQGEEFGTPRLGESLRSGAGSSLSATLAGVRNNAWQFSAAQPFGDDVCLVACELRC